MKNKLTFILIFYIFGIIIAYTKIATLFNVILFFSLLFFGIILLNNNLKHWTYYFIIISLSIIIGFFITKNNLNVILEEYYNNLVTIEGQVVKSNGIDKEEAIVKVENIKVEGGYVNSVHEKVIINLDENIDLKKGSYVRIDGRLMEPLSSQNRFVFNYKKYLGNNKIHGVIFIGENDYQVLKEEGPIYKLRYDALFKISKLIDDNLDVENSAILKSVLFGDSDYLDKDFLENIRKTGIAHIFAVSGLHIGIFIIVFTFIFKLFRFNIRKSQFILLIFLWFYAFIIEFPVSILRALIIFTIVIFANILYRKNSPFNSISLAGLILLFYNPLCLFDVGFLLSFTTTTVIYLYISYISPKVENKIINKLIFIPFIQIGISPILAYYFNYISVFSFLGNLLIVPIFSLILSMAIVGVFTGLIFFPIGKLILLVVNYSMKVFYYILELIFQVPFLGFQIFSPGLAFIFIYYLSLLFLVYLFYNRREDRIYNYIYIFILVFSFFNLILPNYLDDSLEVSFIDVGQGNSSLIRYKDKSILIDAGGDINSNYNKGKKEIPIYLLKQGIRKIDMLFISHYHEDHYCSVEEIEKVAGIKNTFVFYENKDILNKFNTNIIQINNANEIIIDDKFIIKVLWPEKGYRSKDENDNSLVLLLDYKDNRILFTGDITSNVEEEIINNINEDIDILLAPHHGSQTSSSQTFIESLNPKSVILSYGRNFYGIPSFDVVKRYEESGANIYSTYEDGEIWFIIDTGYEKRYTYNEHENDKMELEEVLTVELFLFLVLILINKGDFHEKKIKRIE